jgi:hypothetical protein
VRLDKVNVVGSQYRLKERSDGSLIESCEGGDYCSRQFVVCGKRGVVWRQKVV